ncbi:MAG: hypothetical protein ABIW76_08385 [Fibrobacteria bacterium]
MDLRDPSVTAITKHPRLAEWAYANGLTLEECARIQPSYGTFPQDILALSIDSRNRPWVLTNLGGISERTSYFNLRPDDLWEWPTAAVFSGISGFCTLGDQPLLVEAKAEGQVRIRLGSGERSHPSLVGIGPGPCVGAHNGASFLLGGMQGARRFTLGENGQLNLMATMRVGIDSFPGDTVTHLAVDGPTDYIGTTQGLASRAAARNWHVQSYASLGGIRLGGLKVGSNGNVWAGVLNTAPGKGAWPFTPFSEVGLIRLNYPGNPMRYQQGNSPLPSDTVLLAAPGQGQSIWFTSDGKKLFHFTPPDRLETLPLTLPDHVSIIEVDTVGRLYLATFAPSMGGSQATGVYRVDGDRLVPLGYPLGPSVSVWPMGRTVGGAGLRPGLAGQAGFSGRDALGRLSKRGWGGMFLPFSPSVSDESR